MLTSGSDVSMGIILLIYVNPGLLSAEERAALKAKKYGDVMPNVITEQLPGNNTL